MKRLEHFDAYEVPVVDIFYDEDFNCRGAFTMQSVAELADNIKDIGLQFPVVVQPWEGRYRLLAGHRRFKACTVFLKWKAIPATIRTDLDEHGAQILNLTENLERKDLNILEEARAIKAIYPDGVSLRVAANELKRPTRWVHIRQRLLQMPDEVQQYAAAGRLSAVNLEALWQLPEDERLGGARKFIKAGGSRRGKKLKGAPRRRFRPRKTKAEIANMIGSLLNANIEGLPPRLLAWAAGYITETEIRKDIKQYTPEWYCPDDGIDDDS
jgi:ParB family chromosome partitioning protein